MTSSFGKPALNEGYIVDDLGTEKPTRLKHIRENSKENITNFRAANDPIYETLDRKPRPPRRSNEGYLGLILFACLVSTAALLLTLLLVWGKLGKRCDCCRTEG